MICLLDKSWDVWYIRWVFPLLRNESINNMICLVDNTMGCLGNTINLVTIQKLLKLGYVAPILKSWLQVLYVVITIWWIVTYYLYINKTSYLNVFFLYHYKGFYRTWLYLLVTRRVSYKRQKLLTLHEHLSSFPVIWWGPYCSSF